MGRRESEQPCAVKGQESIRAQLSLHFLLDRGGLDGWRELMTFCSCALTWSRVSRSLRFDTFICTANFSSYPTSEPEQRQLCFFLAFAHLCKYFNVKVFSLV